MKNKIKILSALIFIICITALIMLSGCGDKEITDAYITNSNLPRVDYVEGQELDLSTGYLTLIRGGEEANIPFTAEGVSVSGYDKNKIGEQTVTVSYGEISTSFTVKVIPRIVAENYETKYFINDTLNLNLGRLRIANDDGKTFNVNLNSPFVSVVSFDSSTPGTKTVTVRYEKDSVSYDCQFNVTVYEASSVEISLPKKAVYSSHKEKIEDADVNDGFFTITYADGKLTKIVPLTAAMIKGYDTSKVTIDNREIGYPQTLTIEYLGASAEYPITILFSGVSVVEYYANGALKDLDLSGKLSDDMNAAALLAISELLDLSLADRAMLSEDTIKTVVSAAAVSVTDLFMQKLDSHRLAFAMGDDGQLLLVGANYEATAAALNDFVDPTSDLNVYVTILRELIADFSDINVTANEKVSDVVLVYQKEMEDILVPVLQHLVDVHELLANVPDNWTVETLAPYGTDIIDAVIEIKRSEYYKNGLGVFYTDVLSKWRTKNDLLELVYSYFLYVYDGAADFMQSSLFGNFPMPGTLEDLYESINTTYEMQVYFYQNQNGDAWLADLSRYATSYFLTLDFANSIKQSNNKLWIDIYEKYSMDYVLASYTSAQNFGFLYHTGAMVDSEAYMTLWGQYYGVLQLYLTNNLNATTHKQLITAMFDTFQSMSPSEVFGFLSSLNLKYGDSRGASPVLYLDFETKQEANIFATVLREYYSTYLTEANVPIFANLLMAIESAALFGENEEALANFAYIMEAVIDAYSKLTNPADKANFDEYLGESYKKHLDIYKRITGDESLTKPSAAELELIAKLRGEVKKYEEIYTYLSTLSAADVTEAHYVLLYSAFARATETYKSILATGSDAALTVLFTEGCVFFEQSSTLEKVYYLIDKETTLMMQSSAGAIEKDGKIVLASYWDILAEYGLMGIYSDMTELMYFALIDNTVLPEAARLDSIKAKIAALDEFGSMLFSYIGADLAYYSAKCTYLQSALAGDTAALGVANALAEAALKYESYVFSQGNETYKAEFLSAMEAIAASYAALSEAQKTAVSEVYDFFYSAYTEIKAA